jgi:hypothetical protein
VRAEGITDSKGRQRSRRSVVLPSLRDRHQGIRMCLYRIWLLNSSVLGYLSSAIFHPGGGCGWLQAETEAARKGSGLKDTENPPLRQILQVAGGGALLRGLGIPLSPRREETAVLAKAGTNLQ